MKSKKILVEILAILLVFTSIGLASSAETSGYIGVDTNGGKIMINMTSCQEDWSGSTWSQCVDGEQVFICFDRNNCGTINLKPALCGTTRACGEVSSGGETSSGGSSGSGSGIFHNVIAFFSNNNNNETPLQTLSEEISPIIEMNSNSNESNTSSNSGITGGVTGILYSGVGITAIIILTALAAGTITFFAVKKDIAKGKKRKNNKSGKKPRK